MKEEPERAQEELEVGQEPERLEPHDMERHRAQLEHARQAAMLRQQAATLNRRAEQLEGSWNIWCEDLTAQLGLMPGESVDEDGNVLRANGVPREQPSL